MPRTPVVARLALASVVALALGGCDSRKVQEQFGGGTDPLAAQRAPAETGTVVVAEPLPAGPFAGAADLDQDEVEVVRIGPEGPLISVGTTGLAAQGFSEVIVHGVPSALEYPAQDMVYATMEAILAATPVAADSTIEVEVIRFEDDGDGNPDNDDVDVVKKLPPIRLHLSRSDGKLAIVFPGPKATESERLAAALANWDSEASEASTFEEDAAIKAKISQAHTELRALAKRWSRGAPAGERLSVDAPFDAGETYLYLDVEVTRIEGETITGIVTSKPSKPVSGGVKLGSRVTTQLGDTLDYEWTDAKGETRDGGVNDLIDSRDPG